MLYISLRVGSAQSLVFLRAFAVLAVGCWCTSLMSLFQGYLVVEHSVNINACQNSFVRLMPHA